MNRIDEQSWSRRMDAAAGTRPHPAPRPSEPDKGRVYLCDRCGSEMFELSCKVICPNCGSRFDCSDLSIYFDDQEK